MAVPYAVAPPGSFANARAAASLSPSTSTMSSEGAPRAKEIVSAAMTRRVGDRAGTWRSAREQVRGDRPTRGDDEREEHEERDQDPPRAPGRGLHPRRLLARVRGSEP